MRVSGNIKYEFFRDQKADTLVIKLLIAECCFLLVIVKALDVAQLFQQRLLNSPVARVCLHKHQKTFLREESVC